MLMSRHFVLSWVLLILMGSSITLALMSSNMSTKCMEKEQQALPEFSRSISKGLASWSNTSQRCCEWRGITCDEQTGHVFELNLSDMFLSGIINISALLDLQQLRVLNLSQNHIQGPEIPRAFGTLSNLQTLDLSGNDLNVPNLDWLSGLSSLRHLDLSMANLSQVFDWPIPVSELPSLRELRLIECYLPNFNLTSTKRRLGNFSKSLKAMDLSGNGFDTSLFHVIANVHTNSLVHLRLVQCELRGRIPDVIENLSALKFLDLSGNQFTGGIPMSFRKLCSLESLFLEGNSFSDRLQTSIENLSCSKGTLKLMNLSDNPFSGQFPNLTTFSSLIELYIDYTDLKGPLSGNLDHLSKLRILSLIYNRLTGSVPDFRGLSSLRSLYLSGNLLNGTIPKSIGLLSNLEKLDLHNNSLNGVLTEEHFSNLSSLRVLNLHSNPLTLNLSSDWTPPFRLVYVDISFCKVGPTFPNWIFLNQSKLEQLSMSHGSIRDSIPDYFMNLSSSLKNLDLSFNRIHGHVPSLSSFIYLVEIDLCFNQFSGPLPPFPSNLQTMSLSNNLFSETASSLCPTSTVDLYELEISKNKLSGELPDCWEIFKSLTTLNLQNNQLSGQLPISLGLANIQVLMLSNNNISGGISSLQNATSLSHLDLGDNTLSEKLPEWLGEKLNKLRVLSLRSNKFNGSFPTSLCSLRVLAVLDLSRNDLSGVLPDCFSNMTLMSQNSQNPFQNPLPMYYPNTINMTWKGGEMELEGNINIRRSFDLSKNHFSGEIPESITRLLSLQSLNLSRNNFTGRIPANISRLEGLEILDFSLNQLSGEIPESLGSLHFLNHLNLSYNKLTGKIPLGPQMHTFEASCYIGNTGLFGPPLTADMPNSNATNDGVDARIHSKETDGEEYVTLGFVSLVIGFIAGFWGICGSLLIKLSWRYAYFGFWNKIIDWFHVTTRLHKARLLRRFTVKDNN